MQDSMISQNIVITESCSNLRTLGRNALRGKWFNAMVATTVFTFVLNIPPAIFDSLFGVKVGNYLQDYGTMGMDATVYTTLYNSMPQLSGFSIIYILLITGAMQLGLTMYFLASFRNHKVSPTDVFLGFEQFLKALGLFAYTALFVFLWSLLFLIPGIIAMFRYSQAFYILADDPSKSITQCVNESKAIMRGNKMKFFLLQLSFIGWSLLASLPAGFINSSVRLFSDNVLVLSIVSVLSLLFTMPVYVYIYSTFAGFYEILAGHLIKETQPAPVVAKFDVKAVDEDDIN